MMKNTVFALGILLLLGSCAPSVQSNLNPADGPLDYTEAIIVLGLDDPYPLESEDLGTIKVGDSGFTNSCTWSVVTEKAKLEARKAGGNAVKIMEHRPPDAWSTCHRITAKVLRVHEFAELPAEIMTAEDSVLAQADYALLHIYRLSGMGPLVGYDIYLGDQPLTRVKNNWKQTIKVRKDGLNSLWAKTEAKAELPINIEIGKEYYVRCSVNIGALIGRPSLELVDKPTGKREFATIKEKKP